MSASPNSDTVVRTDPYAEHVTKTAYKVNRSDKTDYATGRPFCELWASGDCIARFVPEKAENVGFMETIQKSMARPWNSLGHGESIELHPAIRVTFPRRLGENADKPVSMKQDAWKDDLERKSDLRGRAIWRVRCLAETLNVSAYMDIIHTYITLPEDPDYDGAALAIRARAKEPGATIVHPNIEAATKISKEYQKTMTRNAGSGELDKALDRESVDESKRDFSRLWPRLNELYSFYVIDDTDRYDDDPLIRINQHQHIHVLLGLNADGSLFDLGDVEDNTIYKMLKVALDVKFKLKTFAATAKTFKANAAPETSATTSTDAPNAVAGATVAETPKDAPAGKVEPQAAHPTAYPNYPESPVVVYPMQNGGVVYKSIRFSVTMRLGGNWTMATVLMDDFAAHREFIDPSCIVNAPPMQNAQTGGATAPVLPQLPMTNAAPAVPVAPNGAGPDDKGRVPGQTGVDRIAFVQKQVNNGKETIELWTVNGKYADHFLRRDSEKTLLAGVGIDIAALQVGTKYPCSLKADWIVTANKNQKNTAYYRDVTAITQVAA